MNSDAFKKRRNVPEGPEPEGEVKGTQDSLVFVVQKHQASRLHYDFRLELDGVLKSWAVPKGPSLNPKEKRLGEKAWLLIKKRDQYASDADITLQDRSVITGKRLGEVR